MTVAQLILKLQATPQDATVAVYSELDEGGGEANEVFVEDNDSPLYHKGDGWRVFGEDVETWVVIS